jgi:hypothetical protein
MATEIATIVPDVPPRYRRRRRSPIVSDGGGSTVDRGAFSDIVPTDEKLLGQNSGLLWAGSLPIGV